MNKELLHELYYRPEFRAMVSMSLAKEVAYLTGKAAADQTDDEKAIISQYMQGAGADIMTEKVCKLAIDDNAIASLGCYHQLTDEIVGAVVTSIFMYKKAYLI